MNACNYICIIVMSHMCELIRCLLQLHVGLKRDREFLLPKCNIPWATEIPLGHQVFFEANIQQCRPLSLHSLARRREESDSMAWTANQE